MNINFVYVPTPDKYNGVIDTMVDPILELHSGAHPGRLLPRY